MFKQVGVLPGLLGGAAMVVASILLAAQPQLSFGTLLIFSVAGLAILVVAAGVAGWKAARFCTSPTLAGAIVGGLVAVGTVAGNMIIAGSPAYALALENLPKGEGGLQLTGFAPTVGSILSLLLIDVLFGTFSASLVARFARRVQRGQATQ